MYGQTKIKLTREISQQIFEKYSYVKCHKIPSTEFPAVP